MIRAARSFSSAAAPLAALLAVLSLSTATFAQAPAGLEAEKAERQRQLEVLRGEIDRTKDAEARLKSEIDLIKDDRKKLAQALLDAAARIRAVETRLSAAENRLPELDKREAKIKSSLESRRAVLVEVLVALQKIGRRPPPALILRPEDALDSVRSAILLGAIIPELKTEADALAADLSELARLRREIAAERDALAQNRTALEDERRRTAAFGDERRRQQSENEKALEAERTKTQALARQVETVRELIARMEKEIASAARAAETARRETAEKTSSAALADPTRIAPAFAFAQAKGRLPLPVSGTRVREFAAPDGLGGTERGLLIMTRTGAQVTAPCDGWVVFAGNFRSYGQLLIINPGSGYHVLLAGMERITVELGQFVLTGEPVAVMGNGPQTATAVTLGSSQPVLHVEFRKDGNSIDSAPWWVATETEKVRG
jgi:septal ring factor EnvC (AmiA/AmiB activator)